MRHIPVRVWRVAAVAALTLLAAPVALGRQTTSPPPPAPRPEPMDPARMEAERRRLERERKERELDLRIVEQEGRRQRAAANEPRLDVSHIVDDFTLLQVASNDLATLAAAQGGPLDLRQVAKSAADIKKRAGRLSSSLGLPKSEKGGRPAPPGDAPDAESLKPSLAKLDTLVDSFAHNPVFREVDLVDAKLSAQARRDLDEIIELSDWLKKNSERLQKGAAVTAQKP